MVHVFDIDGTLLDSIGMWYNMPAYLLSLHGIDIDPEGEEAASVFAKTDPLTMDQGCAWYCEHYLPDCTPEQVYQEMNEYLITMYRDKLAPFPDTLDTLRGLCEAGERIVAFSSTDAHLLRMALGRLGILDWFSVIYTTPEIGYNKVSPMAFAEVAARENVKPEDLIVYEDADFAMAAATLAGCLVINCSHEQDR